MYAGLVSLALVVLLAGCGGAGEAARPATSEPEAVAASRPFVPRTSREGGKVVLPLTFPDGTRAEAAYPPALDLAGMAVRGWTSGLLERGGETCCWRDVLILGGPGRAYLAGSRPARVFTGAELWRARDEEIGGYLVFRFGAWLVLVGEGNMDDDEVAAWAGALTGRETADGFLVLEARPPVRLARYGEHAGPQLMFGDLSPHAVLLIPGSCDGRRQRRPELSAGFGSTCLPRGARDAVAVHVYADERGSAEDVLAGLRLRDLRPVRP